MKRLLLAAALVLGANSAHAVTFNFAEQGYFGPPNFLGTYARDITHTIGGLDITFSGGAVLSGLFWPTGPAYGTASVPSEYFYLPGASHPMTISFSKPVVNVAFDLFAGLAANTFFDIDADTGESLNRPLGPNYYNGYQRVAFSSTLNSFTLFQHAYGYRAGEFDFFVDNVSFDLAQTGGAGGGGSVSAVPVPAGFPLLAAAFAALGALRRRKRA